MISLKRPQLRSFFLPAKLASPSFRQIHYLYSNRIHELYPSATLPIEPLFRTPSEHFLPFYRKYHTPRFYWIRSALVSIRRSTSKIQRWMAFVPSNVYRFFNLQFRNDLVGSKFFLRWRPISFRLQHLVHVADICPFSFREERTKVQLGSLDSHSTLDQF